MPRNQYATASSYIAKVLDKSKKMQWKGHFARSLSTLLSPTSFSKAVRNPTHLSKRCGVLMSTDGPVTVESAKMAHAKVHAASTAAPILALPRAIVRR